MEVKLLTCVLFYLSALTMSDGRPVSSSSSEDNTKRISSEDEIRNFLAYYGYAAPEASQTSDGMAGLMSLSPGQDLSWAIRRFQEAFALPVTGAADEETLKMMSLPRCSMSDDSMLNGSKRKKRYAHAGSRWNKTHLSFSFHNFSPDMRRSDQEEIINNALKLWEDVSNLRFTYKTYGVFDILIRFVRGEHGDGNPFDGVGGYLAHAYYPNRGGDVHFDENEKWTKDGGSGTDLLQVAAHELGHSLGLAHSRERRSIMFPAYLGYSPNLRLHQDDIDGINALYPSAVAATSNDISQRSDTAQRTPRPTSTTTIPTTTTTTSTRSTTRSTRSTTTPTTTTPARDERRDPRDQLACDVTKWDSVVTTTDGNTYFFAGGMYYQKGDKYPRRISDAWSGLRGHFNTAFTMKDGTTYLMQNNRVFVFHNQEGIDISVTRYTYESFQGIPEVFDAAFVTTVGDLFVVKGTQYWRYNKNNRALDAFFPRDFHSAWRGAPDTVDAATTDSQGHTHFFSGRDFYTYDFRARKVIGGPRYISQYWFDC